jgi:hypothetical protein
VTFFLYQVLPTTRHSRYSPDDENDGKDGKNDHVEHDSVHHSLSFRFRRLWGDIPITAGNVSHSGTQDCVFRPKSVVLFTCSNYVATLMPRLTSQTFAGQEVKNPIIMPICVRNQYAAELGMR